MKKSSFVPGFEFEIWRCKIRAAAALVDTKTNGMFFENPSKTPLQSISNVV